MCSKRVLILLCGVLLLVFMTTSSGLSSAADDPTFNKLYVLDLTRANKYVVDDYDLGILAVSLQGIVNKSGPKIWLEQPQSGFQIEPTERFWMDILTRPPYCFSEMEIVRGKDIYELLEIFSDHINGVVIWDPEVPATLNAASTIAGVERLVILRKDDDTRSWYYKLVLDPEGPRLPVKMDLAELNFSDTGRIPEIDRKTTRSAKNNVYIWMIEKYLKTGLANSKMLAYLLDGYAIEGWTDTNGMYADIFQRDLAIMNNAFVFDLSPWGDEVPVDDPDQPRGTDLSTLLEIFKVAQEMNNNEEIIDVLGYVPWRFKYADVSGGKHGAVESEWESVKLMSRNNMALSLGGGGYGVALANASVFVHGELEPDKVPEPYMPPPADKVENRTYILYYLGDYDFTGMLYLINSIHPRIWEQEGRGKIPVAWGINPLMLEYMPGVMEYFYDTATPNDYFVAANTGVGYINPGYLDDHGLKLWTERCIKYYSMANIDITGFFLNGTAGAPSQKVLTEFAKFSPGGMGVNYKQLGGADPRIHDGMPVISISAQGLAAGVSLEDAVKIVDQAYQSYVMQHPGSGPHIRDDKGGPVFLYFRCVFLGPEFLSQLTELLQERYPERKYTVVDPYTFFHNLKLHLEAEAAKASERDFSGVFGKLMIVLAVIVVGGLVIFFSPSNTKKTGAEGRKS